MKKMNIGIAILIQCINVGAMENQRRNTSNNSSNFLPANHFDTKTGIAIASQHFAGAMENQRQSTPNNSSNEEYNKANEGLNDQIQTLTDENTRLQCKLDLMRSVNQVLSANPSLAGRPLIRTRAASVKAIADFVQRKNTMEDLYNRFRAFSNLYGRTDLGVKATKADLNKVRNWIATAQNAYSLYGKCVFPNGSSFSGADIAAPLNRIRERIETGLNGLSGTHTAAAREKLNSIFQNNPAINTSITMTWNNPIFWGHQANEIRFIRNGIQEGYLFQEYGGGNWRHEAGFVGAHEGKTDGGYPNGTTVWNTQFNPRYNAAFQETRNAILQREAQLLDFETNPESELNKAYRQARRVSPTCVDIPLIELDRLISQYNEFMRM